MMLSISELYAEPGYDFKVSYKVIELIRDKLFADIVQPFEVYKKVDQDFLGLFVTTSSKTQYIEVKGPDFDKKNGFINYALWLPYELINQSENYLGAYIESLFEALETFFLEFDVPSEEIQKIKSDVLSVVIDNQDYEYEEW